MFEAYKMFNFTAVLGENYSEEPCEVLGDSECGASYFAVAVVKADECMSGMISSFEDLAGKTYVGFAAFLCVNSFSG